MIAPALGVSSPPTMRITVVLPQPDGPTNTTNSPSAMLSESGSTTSIAPPRWSAKRLVTSLELDEAAVARHGIASGAQAR